MAAINTVLGPADTADLGFTLSHEHVATNSAGIPHTYPDFIDREGIMEQAVAALSPQPGHGKQYGAADSEAQQSQAYRQECEVVTLGHRIHAGEGDLQEQHRRRYGSQS